ncbi:hypothetical protein U0070_004634, partial [Myodes glareolus]
LVDRTGTPRFPSSDGPGDIPQRRETLQWEESSLASTAGGSMATQAPTDAEKECHSMEGPFPSIILVRPSTGQNPGSFYARHPEPSLVNGSTGAGPKRQPQVVWTHPFDNPKKQRAADQAPAQRAGTHAGEPAERAPLGSSQACVRPQQGAGARGATTRTGPLTSRPAMQKNCNVHFTKSGRMPSEQYFLDPDSGHQKGCCRQWYQDPVATHAHRPCQLPPKAHWQQAYRSHRDILTEDDVYCSCLAKTLCHVPVPVTVGFYAPFGCRLHMMLDKIMSECLRG